MPNIDLDKLKNEFPALICIILIVIIAFATYKNIFHPLLGEIREVSAQIEQRKTSIQQAEISPQALKRLEDELDENKTRIGFYHQRLKAKADIPQILKELNRIAEGLKIKFVSVTPLERKELLLGDSEESLLQVPIKIKLQCGYHVLGIFVNQIENSTRFMKMTELKINADSRNIWAHQTELVITSYSLVSKNDYTD